MSYLCRHYFCHDGPGKSTETNHEENDKADEKKEGDKVPVPEVQVVILFDEVINTEQKETGADAETRGHQEAFPGTDPGHAESDHSAE